MVEDLLDDPRVVKPCNDFYPPAKVTAALDIDPEHALQTLGPCHRATALRFGLDRAPTAVLGAAAWNHLSAQTAIGRKYPVIVGPFRFQ
jgi:hypothetical protein